MKIRLLTSDYLLTTSLSLDQYKQIIIDRTMQTRSPFYLSPVFALFAGVFFK